MLINQYHSKSSYIFATIFALRSKTASNISHPRPQPRPVRYDPPLPLMIFHWACYQDSSQRSARKEVPYRYHQKTIEKVVNSVVYSKVFFPIVCMAFNWIVNSFGVKFNSVMNSNMYYFNKLLK